MDIKKLLPQLKSGDLLHREAAKAIESLLPKPKKEKPKDED